MMAASPTEVAVVIDPAFAEDLVRRASRAGDGGDAGPRHAARVGPLYAVRDQAERDAAFGRLALEEFEELGLAERVRDAVRSRPLLRDRVRRVLLAEAGGPGDAGVTCEPDGSCLGIRVEAGRFDRPGRLGEWLRHVLGHAQDTLDPAFGFVPGRSEALLSPPAQARFHRLWDVAVDAGDTASAGSPGTREAHRAVMAADLGGMADDVVGAVMRLLAGRPRPSFEQLLRWAEDRADLIVTATGRRIPGGTDRCPLCGFAGRDITQPDAAVAAAVRREYPDWRPERGLCGRCNDRARLAGGRGGGS